MNTDQKIATARRQARAQVPIGQIAKTLGAPHATVANWCRGIKRVTGRPPTSFTPAEDDHILALYQQGLSYAKIHQQLGKGTTDSVRNAHHRALAKLRQPQNNLLNKD